MRMLDLAKIACAGVALYIAGTITSSAQTFTVIASLTETESPVGRPVQGTDGNFYGISIGARDLQLFV